MALVVRLSQDRRDGDVTCVRYQDGTTGRIEGAQHRRRGESQLQRVEARPCFGRPPEPHCRAAKHDQRRRDLGVALDEMAVVVGRPCESTRLAARRWRRPFDDGLHQRTHCVGVQGNVCRGSRSILSPVWGPDRQCANGLVPTRRTGT